MVNHSDNKSSFFLVEKNKQPRVGQRHPQQRQTGHRLLPATTSQQIDHVFLDQEDLTPLQKRFLDQLKAHPPQYVVKPVELPFESVFSRRKYTLEELQQQMRKYPTS